MMFDMYTYDMYVSVNSQTCVNIYQYNRLTLGTCSERHGKGLWIASIEVCGFW